MHKARPVPEESLDAIVAILDLVRRGRAHSRPEIMERTGLSRAIVTQRVNELLSRGFLTESVAPSTGGRPPRQLEFRAQAGYLLAADIGATSIDAAVTDAAGRILAHHGEPADVSDGPEVILGRVGELFELLLEETRPAGELWGVGVGIPGPVRFGTGHVDDTYPAGELWNPGVGEGASAELRAQRPLRRTTEIGWDGYPVRAHFSERLGVPTWVDNDVNLMALGEWRAGAARDQRDYIFVKVGTGIGAGIVSNGLSHRGAQGNAGVIGHVRVHGETEIVCPCGKVGCLEALAGGGALARDGAGLARTGRSPGLKAILDEHGSVTARDVNLIASMGDAAALELLRRSARLLGQTLADLVDFFNPSLVVLGGGVAGVGDTYLATVRQVIYARSAPLATRDLVVRLSSLGDRAGVSGAASLVLDQLFSEEQLGRWIDRGHPAALVEATV